MDEKRLMKDLERIASRLMNIGRTLSDRTTAVMEFVDDIPLTEFQRKFIRNGLDEVWEDSDGCQSRALDILKDLNRENSK